MLSWVMQAFWTKSGRMKSIVSTSLKVDWYCDASCPLPPLADETSHRSSAQLPLFPGWTSRTSVNSAKTKLRNLFQFQWISRGIGGGFLLLLFFFLFWPSVHSVPRPLSSTNIRGSSVRQARTQIPMKEISSCKTKIMMSIYSMAIILRNSH